MGPGTRQLIELQAAVEDPQILRADKLDGNFQLRAEALVQHISDGVDHRLLARRGRQHLHAQRFVVERNDEAGTAHATQLVEHHRPVSHRQGAKITDAGTHRMGQAARAGDQAFHLAGTQLRQPDHTRQPLGQQHHQQGQQQHAPQQRAWQRQAPAPFSARAQRWPPAGSHCRVRYGSTVAVFRCRAGVGAGG
ncbi:hypothetical protein D9M71_539360 [compost metagenome]